MLDQVFLADPVDSFYAARREHGTMVAIAGMSRRKAVFARYLVLTVQNRRQMWRSGSQEKNCTGRF